jgi:hypothetical protein
MRDSIRFCGGAAIRFAARPIFYQIGRRRLAGMDRQGQVRRAAKSMRGSISI